MCKSFESIAIGIRAVTTMGAPPSDTRTEEERLSPLEEQLEAYQRFMRGTIPVEVAAAFNRAVTAIQQIFQRVGDGMARTREEHEGFMNMLNGEQDEFQEEIRSKMTSLKFSTTIQGEGGNSTSDYGFGKGHTGSVGDNPLERDHGPGFRSGR